LRLRRGIKKVEQSGGEFSSGPGPIDVLQALVGGAVIDLHVAISFHPVLVNELGRNDVLEKFLPSAFPGKPFHELLTNKVGKLL
jgi:hypothetical protein